MFLSKILNRGSIGVHISSTVNWVTRSKLKLFLKEEILRSHKTQNNEKLVNQIKTSEY